jgi:ABC-type sugar transport system substrate-binding protein
MKPMALMGRRARRALAVATAAGLLALGGPAAGHAEAAAGACSGVRVKTYGFATGEVRVYKSRQYVCAQTVAKRAGVRQKMRVGVQARGSRAAVDAGRYTRHAGPVKVFAVNRCVRVTGSVGGKGTSSGWILC